MRVFHQPYKLMDSVFINASTNSLSMSLEHIFGYSIHGIWTVPAVKTFISSTQALLVVQDITYTAGAYGTGGNAITIEYVTGGTAGSEVVTVTGNAISIKIEAGVSTATQVKAKFDAKPAAIALATSAITGTAGTAQVAAVATPLATGVNGDINLTDNTISITAHKYATGVKVAASTTTTLPAPITATNYWVIVIDANTIQLATTLAHALAGTAIDITNYGVGTHTLTPENLTGGAIKLQASLDNSTWIDITSSSQNVTSTSACLWNVTDVMYPFVRANATATGGSYIATLLMYAKGV